MNTNLVLPVLLLGLVVVGVFMFNKKTENLKTMTVGSERANDMAEHIYDLTRSLLDKKLSKIMVPGPVVDNIQDTLSDATEELRIKALESEDPADYVYRNYNIIIDKTINVINNSQFDDNVAKELLIETMNGFLKKVAENNIEVIWTGIGEMQDVDMGENGLLHDYYYNITDAKQRHVRHLSKNKEQFTKAGKKARLSNFNKKSKVLNDLKKWQTFSTNEPMYEKNKTLIFDVVSSNKKYYNKPAVGGGGLIDRGSDTRPLPKGLVDIVLSNGSEKDPNSLRMAVDVDAIGVLEGGRGTSGNEYVDKAIEQKRQSYGMEITKDYNKHVKNVRNPSNEFKTMSNYDKSKIMNDLVLGKKFLVNE